MVKCKNCKRTPALLDCKWCKTQLCHNCLDLKCHNCPGETTSILTKQAALAKQLTESKTVTRKCLAI